MTDINRLENLMTKQHKQLSGQIENIERTVTSIDTSIQGDESRGVAGIKHHIRELKDSSINHHERISFLEQQLPEERRNGNRKMVAGAAAGVIAGGTAVKFGGWGLIKSIVTFLAGLFK